MAFILVFSAFPITATAATPTGNLFSMTLIAPTSNPVRRQWAAIITNSLDSVGIGASLVYVSFSVLLNDFFGCPAGCPPPTYANGGWDAGFVGFGGGTPLPDFGTQNVIVYRDNGPGDVPPVGSNYYFFDNATYNQLSAQYSDTFNAAARTPIIQQMVNIVMQQRPDMVLFYPTTVYAWSSDLQSWGATNAISSSTANTDYSHWKLSGGGTSLNIGETGDISAVNQLPTSSQNSYYAIYLAGAVAACGECIDPRTISYYHGTVNTVSSSSDHLSWTVTEKSHVFSDGVAVTANDYIFNWMSQLRSDVGYVGQGTAQGLLGLNSQFTYLNGTVDYVMNGTYYHGAANKPAGFTPDSVFTALGSAQNITWTFTMPSAYVFTDPVITGVGALEMHVYEGFPVAQWATGDLSGLTSSSGGLSTSTYTYTYPTAEYGGNGSGKAYGPVGDGAYIYKGYDAVAQVGTMVRSSNFYNATGLQAMGWDMIQTVHVDYIQAKDAAVAALANGQVNFLDSNYQFDAADVSSLQSSGATVAEVNDPSNGWQEMGINLNNPYFGTGTGTPLGQSNPSQAAQAALDVRKAISYLIPRQYIVDQLLQGLGQVGITQVCPCFTFAYPSGAAPDPYDPTQAKSFLAAAGYNTGVAPPSTGIPSIPPVSIGSVSVPGFLLGNSFTTQGTFSIDPTVGAQYGSFAVTLEQSSNGGANWTAVALGSTNAGGYFQLTYAPTATGTFQYRVFFTGLPESFVSQGTFNTPAEVEGQVPPIATAPNNVTDTAYSQTSTLNVGSLSDVISALTNNVNTGFSSLGTSVNASITALSNNAATKSDVSTLSGNVNSLSSQVSSVNSQLSTLTDVAYAALAVAIVLGLAAIFLSRRKPSA